MAATLATVAPASRGLARPVLCVVHGEPHRGLEPDVLDLALSLELRKATVDCDRVRADTTDDCPRPGDDPWLSLVVAGAGAHLLKPDGSSIALDLAGLPPGSLASEVARSVVPLLSGSRLWAAVPVVEREIPATLVRRPAPVPPAPPPEVRRPVRGTALASAAWLADPSTRRHAGEIAAGAGVAFLDDRLEAGVRVGWQPPVRTGSPVWARVQAVPFLATVAGRMRTGPVRLCLELGVGGEWRAVVAGSEARIGTLSGSAMSVLLEGAASVEVPAGRWLAVALGGVVRAVPDPTDYDVKGLAAYRAPRWLSGLAVTLRAAFPGGTR